ncbi:MAG: hypothetical protein WC965_02240 [Thiohalomonadaceae bacterium]
MKKFRKKPVAVEAMQWTGNNTGAVMEWAGERRNPDTGELELTFVPLAYLRPKLWVAANSAWVEVEPDEWFIRDARGVYPCKPDIFEATYEPADTPARDEAAELRAALEAVWSWLRSEFPAAPDSGNSVEKFAEQIWRTVCTALATSEGQS